MTREFADHIIVTFFDGKKIIAPHNNENTRIEENGRMYLDLKNERDRAILDVIMKVDKFNISGDNGKQYIYKCIEREFMIDGTTLNISVEKINNDK